MLACFFEEFLFRRHIQAPSLYPASVYCNLMVTPLSKKRKRLKENRGNVLCESTSLLYVFLVFKHCSHVT